MRPIIVDRNLPRMVEDGIAALAKTETFQRGGALVKIVRSDGTPSAVIRCKGAPVIKGFSAATLRERLATAAPWVKVDKHGVSETVLPPGEVVAAILERGEWAGVRPLLGICEAPVLRADGTILQTPGYDLSSGYFYQPNAEFPQVPAAPTLPDAIRARDDLLEVVVDFPFATEAHRAAWLSALLTPFARPAIDGCTPFTAIDGTVRGIGKSLLSDAGSVIQTGRSANRTPQPATDEEMRKRITSLLREGETLIVLDNISRPIDYPSLDAALTTTMWKDRVLGVSETMTALNLLIWLASGNNLVFGGDIIRRTLHIRLESLIENPERRAGFKHPDLIAWLKANRPRLVTAALTILGGYVAAGRPDVGAAVWGSFEPWSRLVAAAVMWVGMPDPQSTRIDLDDADPEKNDLLRLLDGLEALVQRRALTGDTIERGVTAKEIVALADGDLAEVITELSARGSRTAPGAALAVGNLLRRYRRRVVRGRRIDGAPDRKGVCRWWVETSTT